MAALSHVALYVRDLEGCKAFYQTYFDGVPNEGYHNPRTGLRTYFLTFAGGASLELMRRPEMADRASGEYPLGYAHVAFSLGNREAVDALTDRLRADGYAVLSGPRVTGDGYYESCVADPEGNLVELVG